MLFPEIGKNRKIIFCFLIFSLVSSNKKSE
jgi:hypothetical protein